MSTCLKHSTVVGCWNKADNTKENVVIHYTYATNASGVEILKAIRYTISDGTPITLGVGDTVTPGACVVPTPLTTRLRNHHVALGTTPLVIPAGCISLTVTKTSIASTGDVLISGNNLTYFPLILPGETYSIGVSEPQSNFAEITIVGSTATTEYKVIEIR